MENIFHVISNKPFKIFYNGLVPRSKRKEWGFRYSELPVQAQVATYWNRIIEAYFNGEIEKYNIQPKKDFKNKKIIWQYWAQGVENAKDTAKLCFASVDKYKGDYEVIRITDANIDEYLDLPEFIKDKRKNPEFRPVFFSDLLRVLLINVYGGIWLDASILLTDDLPTKYEDYDFFMFSRDPDSVNKDWGKGDQHFYFSWREEFKVKHLSSIMYGHEKSELSSVMLDLLLYFWKNEEEIPHYFFFQIMINELKDMNVIDFNFPAEDDTLPHLLQTKMNKKFKLEEYQFIKTQASLHKLSLHEELKEKDILGNLTYYGFFKKEIFG
ncbi:MULTISPECIES: capsular polysaccharide synthesis protein [Psychrobacter]|uniref:Capsular polysaccharide synthesis protein n=1 Tax=Psychrobacter halodurans TaxID=2818439 RepID=A0AAW4IRI0_9GAMM|nr:capsular polysaccharide synthesis protein [Psychrobacter halodurans]MBO1517761.1 capsular polysaccharide synthesis protein [Psychrobacter halodurans]